jgi:hypothetical protein
VTGALRALPFSYAVPAACSRGAPAVHEPRPTLGARVRLNLRPGQKGTKQLLTQYGDRLVCVRYRYDAERTKRLKTVELIVAEHDWHPTRPRFAPDQVVAVRVAFADVEVRQKMKRAGGRWDPARRTWLLLYERVVALGLTGRIVEEQASGCQEARGEDLHGDARKPCR